MPTGDQEKYSKKVLTWGVVGVEWAPRKRKTPEAKAKGIDSGTNEEAEPSMNNIIKQDGSHFDIKPWDYKEAIGLITFGTISPDDLALLHIDCLSDLLCVAETIGAKYAKAVLEDVLVGARRAAEREALHDSHVYAERLDALGLPEVTEADLREMDKDLPTEADLEYYDAQADAMCVPSARALVRKASAMPTVRLVRVTLFVDGQDMPGAWEVLDAGKFGRQCATLAGLGMAFSVEYKEGQV